MKRPQTNGAFDTFEADLAKVRQDLERLSDSLKEGVTAKTKRVFSEAASEASELEDAMEGVVRGHPITSVLIAAALGLAVGTIFWR